MTSVFIKSKLLQEIDLIPEDKLVDLYHFVHDFRMGVEQSKRADPKQILAFAGSWRDMPDEAFDDFTTEIEARRTRFC